MACNSEVGALPFLRSWRRQLSTSRSWHDERRRVFEVFSTSPGRSGKYVSPGPRREDIDERPHELDGQWFLSDTGIALRKDRLSLTETKGSSRASQCELSSAAKPISISFYIAADANRPKHLHKTYDRGASLAAFKNRRFDR